MFKSIIRFPLEAQNMRDYYKIHLTFKKNGGWY